MIHWFLSKTVRQATDMKRQVRALLNEQRDLLKPQAIENLEGAIRSMESKLRAYPGDAGLKQEMESLETTANSNLKPYPAAAIRENVKEIMVAIATIMAFTTFFLQLTKIPTGSMQPTLYGITDENLLDQPEVKIPNFLGRFRDYWIWGVKYEYFVAPEDGEFEAAEPPRTILPFIKKQRFRFAGRWYTTWLPGDGLFGWSESGKVEPRAVIRRGRVPKGEYVFKVKIVSGDHLLVDRFTYNFRKPRRGEIIVFKTRGITRLPQDQLYIKRLIGLPGEEIRIGDDQHVVADGKRLTAADRHFEMVYSFDRSKDPVALAKTEEALEQAYAQTHKDPPYRGHVNQKVAAQVYRLNSPLAPLFSDGSEVFQVGPNHYLPMGDNQLNSQDGRYFGDFPQKNLIGKCWFVYWPITERFGWGYR